MTLINRSLEFSSDTQQFSAHYALVPKFQTLFDEVDTTINSRRTETSGVLIMGPPGGGKSTFCRKYIEQKTEEHANFQSIYVEACGTSVTQLLVSILMKLGDPKPEHGTNAAKQHRIITLINNRKIAVIFVDEIQDVLPAKKLLPTNKILTIIKEFINKTNAAWVLVGTTDAYELLRIDEQLSERFTRTLELTDFSMNGRIETEYFIQYLLDILPQTKRRATYFSCINQFINQGQFAYSTDVNVNNLLRFLLATHGKPRRIRKLLTECIEVTSSLAPITKELLTDRFASAFSTQLKQLGGNPFSAQINWVKEQLRRENLYA